MAVDADIQVFGIREALKEINSFNPSLRRQITKDIKADAGQQIITAARALIPTDYPLSGMARGSIVKGREVVYKIPTVNSGVTVKVGRPAGKAKTVVFRDKFDAERFKGKDTRTVHFAGYPFALLVAQQKADAGAIWDHAGIHGTNSVYITNLNSDGGGEAPRALARGVLTAMPGVEAALENIIEVVSNAVGRNLKIEHKS